MKKILIISALVLLNLSVSAQQLPNRYLEEITQNITVTKDIVFSTNIPTVRTTNLAGYKIANEDSFGKVKVTLKMDIYVPNGNTLDKKPVIIFAFGGAFMTGERTNESMVALCEAYAKRGFVTATIDYRLGMNVTDQELSRRAVYRALQDGRSAVRFFRRNAATYGIDPNKVFISGQSSGALLALHCTYLDKESERPESTRATNGRPDLGTLESMGDNKTYANGTLVNGRPNGVMSFAGALGDENYIEPNDIPAVYFHSTEDNFILYDRGEPFRFLSFIPGFNLPILPGSKPLTERSTSVGTVNTLYTYNNRGHQVHYENKKNLYSDIAPRGSQFFYDKLLKPSNVTISGTTSVCATCLTQSYTATNTAYYYDWQIVGGTFVNRDPLSSTVTVLWNSTGVGRQLKVTPYSRQLARGTMTSINVNVTNAVAARIENAITSTIKSDSNTININVSPNPFKEKLNIALIGNYTGQIEMLLYDSTGQILISKSTSKESDSLLEFMTTDYLKSGVYYIKIVSKDNQQIKRVLKQ
jgi:acetyl esterase/lipase